MPGGTGRRRGHLSGGGTAAGTGGATCGAEPVEERVRHLLGGGVDQPGAELGDLAADLGVDLVAQQGGGAVVGQLHLGAALGEAGDAALALRR